MSRVQDAADKLIGLAARITMRIVREEEFPYIPDDDLEEAIIHVFSDPDFDPDADPEDIESLIFGRLQEENPK